MRAVFDKAELLVLLQDFYELTGLRTVVFDEWGMDILSYPRQLPAFCQLVRAAPEGEQGCLEIAERLSLDGRRSVVVTGASAAPDLTGAACFDAQTGQSQMIQTRRVPREFHGTGDVFASVLTGALIQGKPLPEATRKAVEFIRLCGERTADQGLPMREGVDFEPLLGLLVPGNDSL